MADMDTYKDPQIGTPRRGAYRFGELPSAGEGMARLGGALVRKGAELREVEERKQHMLDTNEVHTILNDTDLAVEAGVDAIRKEGLSSEEFRAKARALSEEKWNEAKARVDQLRTDSARTYGLNQVGSGLTRRVVAIGDEADSRLIDEGRANLATNRQSLVNKSINAPDDEAYAMYKSQLQALLAGQSNNLLSRQEAQKAFEHDLKTISEERLKTQIRRRPEVVEDYLAGAAGQSLPEHEKDGIREYAAMVERKRAEEASRFQTAAERVFKATAETVEIEVHELARKKQITKDQIAEIALRYRGPLGEPTFSAERVATLQKRLDDRDEVQSDPDVMRDLRLGIQNATTTERYRFLQGRVDADYLRNKISGTDYDHLQARIRQYMKSTEDENKVTYREAHDQVLKEMNALFRIEPGVPIKMFDERAQAYERTLRELNKESAFREGARDPRAWWDENRIRAAGQVRDILEKQIELGRRQFPPQIQTIWEQGKVDPRTRAASAAQALERMKGTIAPAEYMRLRNIVKEQRDMEVEFVRIDAMQPIVGGGTGTNTRGRN
jgi:FKBP-type peptidyl-prolyl cis-trans isomerase